jgi:hypothetical protein
MLVSEKENHVRKRMRKRRREGWISQRELRPEREEKERDAGEKKISLLSLYLSLPPLPSRLFLSKGKDQCPSGSCKSSRYPICTIIH